MKNFWHTIKPRLFLILAVIGPGLITSFADNDAGGVATYSVAAAKFGYNIHLTFIPITLVLLITQEIGARIAIVTGKGLGDLIREKYGVVISVFFFLVLFVVNQVVILQNISGIKAALQLFNLNIFVFLPLVILFLIYVITRASYAKIEKFFLFLAFFYIVYLISAFLVKPDWLLHIRSIVIPYEPITFDFFYTSIAVLGTTVTAWGQFFVHSYIIDKNLTTDKLKLNRLEIYLGAFLTNIFSMLMMIAVIATIWEHHINITDAASASLAIRPLAGEFTGILFGVGLLVAGFIGAAIVPLATAYAFSEFFGYSGSLDEKFSQSKLFYGIFLFQILFGVFISILPQISLFKLTLFADFLNGIFLPFLFFFLYKNSNNAELMGKYKNTALQNILLVGSGVVISIASIVGLVGELLH